MCDVRSTQRYALIERREGRREDKMHAVQQAAAAVSYARPSLPMDMPCSTLRDALLHSARPDDVTLPTARRSSFEEPVKHS